MKDLTWWYIGAAFALIVAAWAQIEDQTWTAIIATLVGVGLIAIPLIFRSESETGQ